MVKSAISKISRAAGSAAGSYGPPPRPEGEQVTGHASNGEESPVTLANLASSGDAPTTNDSAKDPAVREEVEITRATMRLTLNIPVELRAILHDVALKATTVKNVLMRALVSKDSETLDLFQIENGRRPKTSKEWKSVDLKAESGLNLYQLGRRVAPSLATGMMATIARQVASKWSDERWEAMISQKRSPPHFREGQGFPVRAQDLFVESDKIMVTLYSGEHEGARRFALPVMIRDAKQREAMRCLVSKEWRPGAVTIEPDRIHRGKWYARISYTRKIDPIAAGTPKYAAINRGIKNFVVAVVEGEQQDWSEPGAKIEAYLKQIQARRRAYQQQIKSSARIGHGRKRALLPTQKLEDKAARWRKTTNQTMARRLATWMRDRGVTHLFIEDLSGIRDGEPERLEGGERIWRRVQEWPYFDFGTRLESCLEEYGIRTTTVSAKYISQTCPTCGAAADRNLKSWSVKCPACGYYGDLDRTAAINVLARGKVLLSPASSENGALPGPPPPKKKAARKRPKKK